VIILIARVIIAVLGEEFKGVLGCDYFSAYRRYMRTFGVAIQFCLAHLIRDVKYLTTLPDTRDRAYGERLRAALRKLFGVIHQREQLSAAAFQSQLEAAREEVVRCGTQDVPPTKPSLDFHGADFANGDQRVVMLQLIETNHQWLVAKPRHRGRFVSES
jgi:hypothetical protein